jgi:hypothetical protein
MFGLFIIVAGSTFTSARLIYAAGREGYLPALFGRLHRTRKTPLNAMLLQAALTMMFITIGGGFRSLMTFSVVASWAFYFLTVGYQKVGPYQILIISRIGVRTCDFACQRAPTTKARNICGNYLEVRQSNSLTRPYKTWIITPLAFCAVRSYGFMDFSNSRNCVPQVALFLLCMPILAAPLQAIAVLCRSAFNPFSGIF